MSQTSAWDAFVGTKAPWRERRSTTWTHWKGRRRDRLPDSSSAVGGVAVDWHPRGRGRCGRPAFVEDRRASESSSSGDDADTDAAHEWLQEWDVPEASGSKRHHALAAAIAAEFVEHPRTRTMSERLLSSFLLRILWRSS